jgi:uncharacterized protein YggT (Ycf19 family)
MKNFIVGIILWLVLATLFWLAFSLVAWDMNPAGWHWFLRFVYAIGGLYTFLKCITEDWI